MKSQLFLVVLVCVFCFLAPAKAFSQDDGIPARRNHHYQLVSKVPETNFLWELQEFIIQQEQEKKEDEVLLFAMSEKMSCDDEEVLQLFFFAEHTHCR